MSQDVDISVHRAQIEAALEYASGTHTFDDICAAVASGAMQYWPGPTSAAITEIFESPRKRILNFFLAGGNIAELERMQPHILEWARQRGCSEAMFIGRRGWERSFLTRTGWTNSGMVVLTRPL